MIILRVTETFINKVCNKLNMVHKKHSKRVGRPRTRDPKDWGSVKLRKKTRDVLRAIADPGDSISDSMEKILILGGFMTKDYELTQAVKDSIRSLKARKDLSRRVKEGIGL